MRTTINLLLSFILISIPAISAAHIYLKEDGNVIARNTNGVTCGTPSDYHALFISNSTVDILYSVGIPHDPFEMYLIDNSDESIIYTLVENIPDTRGQRTQSVSFPDIECESCTFKLSQNTSYSSCADITLTSRENIPAANPVSQIQSTQTENSITLTWENPSHINQVLILQSDSYTESNPDLALQYQNGDLIDGAKIISLDVTDTLTIDQLTHDTEYYFQIFTRNMAGNYSQASTFMTSTNKITNYQPMISLADIRSQSDEVCEQAINIAATVTDTDLNDTHTISWTTSPYIENQSTDPLSFYNSTDINDGTDKQIQITAMVTDNGTPIKSHSQVYEFNCMANTTTPEPTTPEPIVDTNHAPTITTYDMTQMHTGCNDIVEVYASIADEDENDTHTVQWSVLPELENQSLNPLVFINRTDTLGQESKSYTFTVTVTDSGSPEKSNTREHYYFCEPPLDQGLVLNDTKFSLGSFSYFLLWMLSMFTLIIRFSSRA